MVTEQSPPGLYILAYDIISQSQYPFMTSIATNHPYTTNVVCPNELHSDRQLPIQANSAEGISVSMNVLIECTESAMGYIKHAS